MGVVSEKVVSQKMASLQEKQETRFIAIIEGRRLVPATPELFFQFVLHINNPTHTVRGLWLQRFTVLVSHHIRYNIYGLLKKSA